MITGVAHVCFIVSNLEASERFYCGQLGMQHAFDFKAADGRRTGMYILAGRRTFIEIFEGKVEAGGAGASFRHTCLEVDDFDATVATLRARGVEVTDVKLGMDNSYQAWLKDPDGNAIELHGYTAKSWQAPFLAR